MSNIYCIGETVLDIIFKNEQPVAAKAGGSALNTAVSLGRLGCNVFFISEYANDKTGKMIDSFLLENNVKTNFVYRFDEGKTALSLAFLNEHNDADYSFYKIFPEKRFCIKTPDFLPNDIVHFGSMYSVNPEIRDNIFALVSKAKTKGCIVVYDPNVRNKHKREVNDFMPYFRRNFALADIVRGSDEDFYNLFKTNDIAIISDQISAPLIYTQNKNGVTLVTHSITKHYDTLQIQPVSTIGAGDNFNAGIEFGLQKLKIQKQNIEYLTENEWDTIINSAIQFSSHVCMSYENYISKEFANSY